MDLVHHFFLASIGLESGLWKTRNALCQDIWKYLSTKASSLVDPSKPKTPLNENIVSVGLHNYIHTSSRLNVTVKYNTQPSRFPFILPVFFQLVRRREEQTSETTEFAAFPIMSLNAGAQITQSGQVQKAARKL